MDKTDIKSKHSYIQFTFQRKTQNLSLFPQNTQNHAYDAAIFYEAIDFNVQGLQSTGQTYMTSIRN